MIDKGLISLNAARPLDFNLSYNSLLLDTGTLGKGWGHNHETRMEVQADGSLKLCWAANRNNTFTTTDQVNYTSTDNACRLDKIVKNADGTYTLTRKDLSQYDFDASGHLTEQKSGTGMALQMTCDANGKLATITEPLSGSSLDLTYNAGGFVQSATDDLNRVWQFTYDASNNMTAIGYPDGTSSAFTYDTTSQVLTETDPQGNLLFSNTYDTKGRVISQDDGKSGNQLSTISYDETSQPGQIITTITDRTGHSKKYYHDSSYQLVKVVDELDNETSMTYDEDGNRTSVIDAAGHTTSMTYDDWGNILTSTDVAGNTTTMTYDDCNNLLTVQNALGKTITNTYDTNNRLLTIADPYDNETTFTYNTDGLLTGTTSPRGGTTSNTYVNGLLQTTTDPTSRATTMAYDAAGRLISTTDAAGKTTSITYDTMNRILTTTDPLGNVISFTYDGNGKVLTQTDARGNTTTYAYDGNRNLSSTTDALGNATSFAYDGEDRIISITDPRGNQSTIAYDAKGRRTSITDALGHTVTMQYDVVDNVTAQIDALNNQMASITYDDLNRPIRVTDALGNTSTNTYDNLGNLTQSGNPLNQITQFNYDDLNRLIETVDAINGVAAQEFDADGNRTALIDTNNNRQEFTFDLAGRLTESSSDTGTLAYTYNQIGLLSSLTNGRGQTRSLQYDDAGRPVSQTDPDGSISCTYDFNGNLLTVVDASGTITRQYDALNRVVSYTDTRGNTIEYDYDANGNLICLTYPDDKEVEYTYDAANRLTQVEDWAGRITTYTYDANNRLIETTRPDGSIETRTYDNAGRLTQQLDKDQSDNILTQFDFTYNAAGNVTEETNSWSETPLPDEDTTMTYTSDNRLSTYNNENVVYDADGNMTSGPLNGQIAAYTFDSRNRLTAVGTTTYSYDAENNRIAVNQNGTQYDDIINPNASLSQVLMRTGPGETETFYVYGLGLIGEQSGEDYRVYHYDLRGSTVMLTDATGVSTDTYQYGPYGKVINHIGTSTTPFQYNGRDGVITDGNGLYYMRARYYESESKRFLSRDIIKGTIVQPISLNRYSYVTGNPSSIVDPLGLWGSRVHSTYTEQWAINSGFSASDAKTIASADNAVDGIMGLGTMSGAWFDNNIISDHTWDDWHFDINGSLDKHFREKLDEAIRIWEQADKCYYGEMQTIAQISDANERYGAMLEAKDRRSVQISEALKSFGTGLHAMQDIHSHHNVTTMEEHNQYEYPKGESRAELFVIDNPDFDIDWDNGGSVNRGDKRLNNTQNATMYWLNLFRQTVAGFDKMYV